MASVWLYVVLAGLSMFVGAILLIIIYFFYTLIERLRLRKVPKNPKEVTLWVKDNKEQLTDGGKMQINKKEVEEDERRQYERYRLYEKLRRDSYTATKERTGGDKKGTSEIPESPYYTSGIRELSERESVQSQPGERDRRVEDVFKWD